ncbi:putative IMPortin-alpha re-exporter [Neospora caninum Liverpool]|uniref:Importin-alpha re-exporter, putative n=1 Tax=Neospora caninum (strain Liverpool) TaxID=572307 RepID=F0V9B3_NEOCL|nr:putative IMPortin-alpha re-exporter [Neospora caninum Liverpool]CBZ50338.1 putative IMPortin-alpha re-exporter [Neospora caninum Liverpool]CEL64945.1 TPA: importin-alpha re-exporter, putative [Neospora caninum Liverpool]|eukprot:XP_003880372.1 putative IMPortin-alpha re-exporter [Neospora caninum Liverpool]
MSVGAPAGAAAGAPGALQALAAQLPLAALLEETLAANPAAIRCAEEELQRRSGTEAFAKDLLLLLVGADASPAAKQAGAIYFKNYIRRLWDVDPQQGGISEANRVLVKEHLLCLLLAPSTEKRVQMQLADALARIAETDLPLDWPTLLPELSQKHLVPTVASLQQSPSAAEQKALLQQQVAALEILHAVLKKYRSALRSDDVLLELQQVLPATQEPLLQVFGTALKLLEVAIAESGAGDHSAGAAVNGSKAVTNCPELLEVLLLASKVFFSLNTVDLPEFFEDHLRDFIGGFVVLLRLGLAPQQIDPSADADEDIPGLLEKVATQVCINLKLYADKYQEEFQPFVAVCTHAVWENMQKITSKQRYDFLAAAAMDFLSSAASTAWQAPEGAPEGTSGDPFADANLLKEICEKIIVPNVQLSDYDIELIEDSPLEFTRRDLDGGEHHATRRSSALELVKSLSKLHDEAITTLLLQIVNVLSAQASSLGGGETLRGERLVDASTFLVMAVGIRGSTRFRGVQAVNARVDVEAFFKASLLEELKKPDINKHVIVRLAAIKVIAAFRNKFDVQLLHGVLPLLVAHLASSQVIVHTYAAYALERLLNTKQNGKFKIDKASAAPLLKQATEILLRLLETTRSRASTDGLFENEFIMSCLLRIFIFLKEDAMSTAMPALSVVLACIQAVAAKLSNPSFSHYLFECLATLVKIVSASTEHRAQMEAQVIPVLSVLIQQTLHDFIPYCFQVLGLLLETAEDRNAATSQLYVELYRHLLQPSVWAASQGNVPALIRLIGSYCRRHVLFTDLIKDNMQTLLERFQYCLYHKKLMSASFDLLNTVFKLLPFPFYAQYFNMILTVLLKRVHELNKRQGVCRDVCLSLMVFQCKSEDPSSLVNALETIQPNLSQQVLSFIVLPAVAASPTSPLRVKKVLILGLARMATCPAVTANKPLLSATLEALAMLISKKEEEERSVQRTQAATKELALEEEDDGPGLGGAGTAAEFDVTYARLAAADVAQSKDLVEEVTDVQGSVQRCLTPLRGDIEELAKRGANVKPLLPFVCL